MNAHMKEDPAVIDRALLMLPRLVEEAREAKANGNPLTAMHLSRRAEDITFDFLMQLVYLGNGQRAISFRPCRKDWQRGMFEEELPLDQYSRDSAAELTHYLCEARKLDDLGQEKDALNMYECCAEIISNLSFHINDLAKCIRTGKPQTVRIVHAADTDRANASEAGQESK